MNVVEILPITQKAAESIDGVKIWDVIKRKKELSAKDWTTLV